MATLEEELVRLFGHRTFKNKLQHDAVRCVLEG